MSNTLRPITQATLSNDEAFKMLITIKQQWNGVKDYGMSVEVALRTLSRIVDTPTLSLTMRNEATKLRSEIINKNQNVNEDQNETV